ncbi:single-stranded DNA-binding protein [Nocardioides lijunqiniae]|uniref:single-stranded DNA-binding protein n=1 Tax=Nocardioides lijunqiniae TaxID=2760832 RepID=UPI0018779563|nr:single-stranded DNA-binding protein [Nocardioides lijunqiniae]
MINETVVTLQGWLGADPQLRQAGDAVVASFRVASTPRRFRRSTQEWVDGSTQWYTVNAWRALGEHCGTSLHRGDPVIVHGRLNARTYVNKSGQEVTSFEVEADAVGHDLTRGVSRFARAPRAGEGAAQEPAQESAQENVESAAGGPPADGSAGAAA